MDQDKRKFTVFLVDDDEFLLDMYAMKFKSAGFVVDVAYSGEEALSRLKKGLSPDIILLDILMPKLSGFELLEVLKNEKIALKSKILVLSNMGQQEDIEKGERLGAAGYIVKAKYTPSEVVEKARSLL